MPGYRYTYPEGTSSELYDLMQSCSNVSLFRRIQSIYLRSKYGYLPSKISAITGLSLSRITHIHSEYQKSGKESLIYKTRGGRNHSYLSFEAEEEFLEQFKQASSSGSIVTISRIKESYERLIDKKVNQSMIYKLLNRHKWRKILPRPRHPNQDVEAIDAFKKTFPQWLP